MTPSETWVLLRGLTREAGHWGGFAEALARARPQAHLLMLDMPGAGRHHQQASPLDVAAIARACRAEARARGATGPLHLLGLSMGGMVVAEWLLRHPQEVAAAVIVNSSTRSLSPLNHRLRLQAWPQLPGLLRRWGSADAEARVLALSSARPALRQLALPDWAAIQRQRPVSRGNALRQLLAAARYRLPAARPACPVLVVRSRADALVHPACSSALARHWRVPLREHPSAGHDLALDEPEWLAQQIDAWLRHARPAQQQA